MSAPKIGNVNHPAPATLLEDLAELADFGADLETEFGLRPDRVFVVRYVWSGKEVGAGVPTRGREVEVLPRPVLAGPIAYEQAHGAGLVASGSPRLEGLSSRFVEADLDPMAQDLAPGEELFVEVVRDRRDGREPLRLHFRVSGRPTRRTDTLDYVLPLVATQQPRTVDKHRRDWSRE